MNKRKLRFNVFVFMLFVATFYAACKKNDLKEEKKSPLNKIESRFFNEHQSKDTLIQSIITFIKGQNGKYRNVEKIVSQIGYPYWDKATIVSKPVVATAIANDSDHITYIPFVRDSEDFVNASLIVRTSTNDTGYKFLCDWQYSSYGYDTTATGWNARDVFHIFAQLDNQVFGRNEYKITDENLLTQAEKNYMTSLGLSFDSARVVYQIQPSQNSGGRNSFLMPVTICNDIYTCIQQPLAAFKNNTGVTQINPGNCASGTWLISTICTEVLVDIPSGNTGGTGGTGGTGSGSGGSGGGGSPSTCTSNCTSGWQPVTSPTANQMLQAWDDSIIIDITVRPCIVNVLNKVRDVDSGIIAKIIKNLAGDMPGFDWEIREVPSLPSPYQTANALTSYEVYYRSAITDLNYSVMQNSTNIMVAQTLMHESVHAFLYDYYNNYLSLTPADRDSLLGLPYSKLIKDFMKKSAYAASNSQHNLMVDTLRNQIKNALKEVCPLLGINLSPIDLEEFCNDMSWGGLQDESPNSPWSELDPIDRTRIMKRLELENYNLPSFSGYVYDPKTESNYPVSIVKVGIKTCP